MIEIEYFQKLIVAAGYDSEHPIDINKILEARSKVARKMINCADDFVYDQLESLFNELNNTIKKVLGL